MSDKDTKTWTTSEVQKEFTILSFYAPFVEVIHKESGKKGVMQFDGQPRVYYDFVEGE